MLCNLCLEKSDAAQFMEKLPAAQNGSFLSRFWAQKLVCLVLGFSLKDFFLKFYIMLEQRK